MNATATTTDRFHSVSVAARDIHEGMTIRHLDGEPAVVSRAGIHKDEFGYAYDFSFVGDRVPFAARGTETFERLVPMPKVGDFATLCYPSDRYPLLVLDVSPTGSKINLVRLDYRVVSGSFQSGDAVIEYSMPQGAVSTIAANWSPRRRCYTAGGTPIHVGHARFYQSPEV